MIFLLPRSSRVGLSLLGALFVVSLAQYGVLAASDEKPPVRAQDSASNKRVPGAPGQTSGRKKADKAPPADGFPQGVTVLVKPWKDPKGARDFPPGVTVLSPIPTGTSTRPVVRVLVPLPQDDSSAGAESAVDENAPPEGQDLLKAPAERLKEQADAERRRRAASGAEVAEGPRDALGPSLREQVQNLPGPPHPGGDPTSPNSSWTPVDAWPDRDEANPYPWNPAVFSRRILNPHWEAQSSWAPRDPGTPYPWNPSSFSTHLFDPVWQPSDSWGRRLASREEPEPVNAAATPEAAADMTTREGKRSSRTRSREEPAAQDQNPAKTATTATGKETSEK